MVGLVGDLFPRPFAGGPSEEDVAAEVGRMLLRLRPGEQLTVERHDVGVMPDGRLFTVTHVFPAERSGA